MFYLNTMKSDELKTFHITSRLHYVFLMVCSIVIFITILFTEISKLFSYKYLDNTASYSYT